MPQAALALSVSTGSSLLTMRAAGQHCCTGTRYIGSARPEQACSLERLPHILGHRLQAGRGACTQQRLSAASHAGMRNAERLNQQTTSMCSSRPAVAAQHGVSSEASLPHGPQQLFNSSHLVLT